MKNGTNNDGTTTGYLALAACAMKGWSSAKALCWARRRTGPPKGGGEMDLHRACNRFLRSRGLMVGRSAWFMGIEG